MEERYWLRHSSLAGHVGPFTRGQLHDAIVGGSLPRSGEILRDEGQGREKREASVAWSPVALLLGLPPEPEPAPETAAAPSAPLSPYAEFLGQRRADSPYRPLRLLIDVGTWLAAFFQLITLIPWPRDWNRLNFIVFCEFVLSVVMLFVVRGLLHVVLDWADRGVRREFHEVRIARKAADKR
ncbi:MAG: hypothetical protein KDC48_16260 [Planctomycetes bacterium]|nr:hypothetical protein [Planctomycetota bacterium]